MLDDYLLSHDRVLTTVATSFYPPVITKQMEQLVCQNFQILKEFEECLCSFRKQEVVQRSVQEALLNHFEDILKKVSIISYTFLLLLTVVFSHIFQQNDSGSLRRSDPS